MVNVYADLVRKNVKTIDEVPMKLRAEVKVLLAKQKEV